MFANGATAHRLARQSRVTSYAAGRRAWTEVTAHADGSFSVTKGEDWYDSAGQPDYAWTTTKHATRAEAFAAAGLADPDAQPVAA